MFDSKPVSLPRSDVLEVLCNALRQEPPTYKAYIESLILRVSNAGEVIDAAWLIITMFAVLDERARKAGSGMAYLEASIAPFKKFRSIINGFETFSEFHATLTKFFEEAMSAVRPMDSLRARSKAS
ncbi:MAG: hypothetical protein KW793_01750 [Candidatus Doudnabacteria bacterium]|nr:hypothetical protein [Candidatus Doudnabacteria bacterium]